ncbi:MAG: MBL fold metallo-hydrolase [Deltaproteobacteria bacterium]|nr:MBL fold metallo-hydrolase [Deltaproteobacteria bacterium]
MRGLVARPQRAPTPELDPEAVWYRRAAGLEFRFRPDESWSELDVLPPDHRRAPVRLSLARAAALGGLSAWRPAAELAAEGLPTKVLWGWAGEDLVNYAEADPGVPLSGRAGALAEAEDARGIAVRRSAWPTAAVETAVHVAPMPFMPRGQDLEGATLVGLRVAGLERGHEVLGATLTGSARTGQLLRDLWPRLSGRHTRSEILGFFDKGRARDDAGKLLELLDALTFLEARGSPPEPAVRLAAPAESQVTWLGHAGVLVQGGGASILIDPLFFSASEPEAPWTWPKKPDPRALPPVDAVFITHGDNDHLNPNTLLHLPRSTPIYLPRTGAYPPPFQVDMQGILRVLGFTELYPLAEGDVVSVGGLRVEACPFVGEDWDLALAQLTYLVEAPGFVTYYASDSARMDFLYEALAARLYPVDLAFMGVSGAAEPMVSPPELGYGNFYQDWIPPAARAHWRQHCAGPEDAARSVGIFKPRYAFGYAAGGGSFVPMAYCDRGDHDAFAARLAEAGGATKAVSLPMGYPVTKAALAELPAHSSHPR